MIAFGFPFSPSYYYTYGRIYSAIFGSMPWSLLSKALHDMGLATASKDLPGLTWGERASCELLFLLLRGTDDLEPSLSP